ncbi:MAG: GGDEF domain-containing protein [Pseudomonadota bacterium]
MPHSTARKTEELILLAMTMAGSFAVFPFAITRLMQGEWLLGALDLSLVVSLLLISSYVFRTHKTEFASIAVCALSVGAIVGTVYIKGVSQVFWTFPTVLIVFYLLTPTRALFACAVALTMLLPKLLTGNDTMTLMTTLSTIVLTIAFSYAFSKQTANQRDQLVRLATKDPLTGASNRRALSAKLDEIIAQHRREPVTASILMIDLDHFKRVNDKFGHAAGDQVLIGLVRVIKQRIRSTDSVFRIGGEEFAVLSQRLDEEAAEALGEDLRVLVEAARLAEDYPITISVGVAQLRNGETFDDWLRRGDNALYAAKDQGRNRVISVQVPMLSEIEVARMERDAAQKPAG